MGSLLQAKGLLGAAGSRAKGVASVLLTAEQHEKIAQACYKAAEDKDVPPAKRLEFRMMAKRGRILVRLAREEEARKAKLSP